MLTRYGSAVGARMIRRGDTTPGLKHLLAPVGYWRALEFTLAMEHGDFRAGQDILDIGSPKLLALYLADKIGATVHTTDIDDYFLADIERYRRATGVAADRLIAEVQDARRLSYDDDSFDRVVSISVLEHIGEEGDAAAAAEIARVLRPGGIAVITVPFSPEGRDVYLPVDEFYWADHAEDGQPGMAFFEHHYTEAELHERLIEPSGLTVATLGYLGERSDGGDKAPIYQRLPRAAAPLQPLLAKVLLRGPVSDWRELPAAHAALLVLTKPGA